MRERVSRRLRITLAVILLTSAALRLIGIGHGLPFVTGADEGFEIHRALELGAGQVDLERTVKGGFFYLLFLEYAAYFVLLLVTGRIGSAQDFALRFASDLTPFWMIARVTHALVAVLVVAWAFRLGRRMYGPIPGVIAASVVALSTLHVEHAHYVGVDLPMVLLVLLCLEVAHGWSNPDNPARPVLLGALFGGAVMTKIVAVVVVIPIALANWFRLRGDSIRRRLLGREILLAYAVSLLVFLIGNPGALLNSMRLWESLLRAFGAAAETSGFVEGPAPVNLWLYYWNVLLGDLGLPLLLVGLAGLVLALVRRRPADLLLASTGAAFFVIIASAETSDLFYPRYMLPIIPIVAILAARVLAEAATALPLSARARAAVVGAMTLALLVPAVRDTYDSVTRFTRPDSREVARAWIEENVPAETPIFLVGNPIVDVAPNLSLPLRNTNANIDRLIAGLDARQEAQARVLHLRKTAAQGRPFDLRTVRHFEPNRTLEDYEREGVQVFVLVGTHFDPAVLAGDRKHSNRVLASRRELDESLRGNAEAELAFRVDPQKRDLTGPTVEVFRLRSPRQSPEAAGSSAPAE